GRPITEGLVVRIPFLSLHSLNIKVEPGSIVAVVGHVGSGKSSLLSAMLGEMERRSGSACIKVREELIR
uniref:ABC transporter domain-containing protein n=1 Tax=Sphaeramia orbicularis TaxID=375764 RepID=A0A673B1B7_9TELE